MAIRDILVTLDAGTAAETRMHLAVALARSHEARLTAIYALPVPRSGAPPIGLGALPPSTGAWAPAAPESGPPREPERAEQIEAGFRAALHAAHLDGDWYLIDEGDTAELIDYANAVDLTILGQQAEADGAGFRPDDIVVEVGRPALTVPYVGTFATVGQRALIAWDGTREASRALNDALPLIAGAEATVLYIGSRESQLERRRPALERIVAHLQRHGIKARPEETPRGDIPISDLLLSRAADLGADLIVAGAYHHSPRREALLGGVSRELLRHMTVPVLMSH
jgi:nucleotide-binding universal stress UspA family protein